MKISLLTSAAATDAAHILDLNSADELHHWLLQDNSNRFWCVAVWHGGERPVLILGPRTGALLVMGGWKCPRHVAETVWDACEAAIRHEHAVDQFLDSMTDFTRRAIYHGPKIVTGDDP